MFLDTGFPNIIQLKQIYQSYDDGKIIIFEGLDFLVEDKPGKGQFVAILGPSGCGKSTLLRYIAGLQKPTKGEVLIHDKPLDKKTRVSMVFQQYSSLPWYTVFENIELPLKYQGIEKTERTQKVNDMIEFVGLSGHENKYARYPVLSGGQLQRVAIARCVVANPDILLMDEPFGALDINTRLQMQDLLLKIWRKYHSTIIFVTHDIPEAAYLADDIYIMGAKPGRFVEHIINDLPSERDKNIKRQQGYVNMVYSIEDKMINIK